MININEFIKICKSLTLKRRLKITKLLMQNKRGLIPLEISYALKLPLATTVRNLMILRNAKVIRSFRVRNKMVYIFDIKIIKKFGAIFKILEKIQL